jgi:glucuronoarabinoxylan endo-1,4-beta-xylanase
MAAAHPPVEHSEGTTHDAAPTPRRRVDRWLALTLGTFAAGCGAKTADRPSGMEAGADASDDSSGMEAGADAPDDSSGMEAGPAPAPVLITIDPGTPHQTMDGFGASDAFSFAPLSAAQVTAFFDPTNGVGLSLLRVGISPTGDPLGAAVFQDAVAAHPFGVRVWAAPWSPPGADKSNGTSTNGGTLDPNAYQSWANVLAGFATTFQQTTGFPLYALSAQNEPDFTASYVSCVYTPDQMTSFVKVLGPMLANLSPPVLLLAPEPDTWDGLWGDTGFGTSILGDPVAAAAVGIMATHDYSHMNDSVPTRVSPPAALTQPLWETEVSDETARDLDIGHGIQVAIWVYAAVTTGGASAWHYWQLVNGNPNDGEGLLERSGDLTNPPKRLYTVGNFSKFVRPGYVRIETSGSLPPDVYVVSFQNPADGTLAVVGINAGTTDVPLAASLQGTLWPTQMTPWVTSATDSLSAKAAIALSAGNLSASLQAQSVTTFVGTP